MSASKIRSWSCICHVLASALPCHVSQIRPCASAAFLHMRGADNVICRFANDKSSHFGRSKLDIHPQFICFNVYLAMWKEEKKPVRLPVSI
ncbi:hypothetical protein HDV62DRAFT_376315 [Trichoderma sp. SZMC 28011]